MAPSYGLHRALRKAKRSVMHRQADSGTETGTDAVTDTNTEASVTKKRHALLNKSGLRTTCLQALSRAKRHSSSAAVQPVLGDAQH
ncbi:MAG: hypothetical protein FRX49_13331 [Trebouxia sp. A1-2]|nr:MAG: hypothetical protein FRX49_13331 [Trebouxia sp. A1-2]